MSVATHVDRQALALTYLTEGRPIFPVCTPIVGKKGQCLQGHPEQSGCKNPGKTPLVKWQRFETVLATRAEAEGWWRKWPDANIGMATGELSGFVVIDLDGEQARAMAKARGLSPHAAVVTTGRPGGYHVWYRWTDEAPRNFASHDGIDFRGEGGYVVLPGSLHQSGAEYQWLKPLNGEALDPWPKWLLEFKAPERGPRERLDTERLLYEGVAEGARDLTLFRLASKFRGADVPYEMACELVAKAASECTPPFDDWLARVDSAYGRYAPNPPGSPRLVAANGRHVDEATGEVLSSANGLPSLICNGRQLRDVTSDALAALVATNNPPVIFQRGKEMVRVVQSAESRPVIQPLQEAALRGELARSADWATVSQKGNLTFCPPPVDVVRDLASLRSWPSGIPPLVDIVEAPALRPDGSILLDTGYDAATGVFYMPRPGLGVPTIPSSPSAGDVTDALCVISDVIGEFPFDTPASWAGAVGLMLTPLLRPYMGSAPAPLALLDAPQQGSGKSLLARVAAIVATGQEAAAFTAPCDEAEWRKAITAMVRAGSPFVLIDNVDPINWQGEPIPLRSAALSAILTTGVHRDRVLGSSTIVDLPTRSTWALSANNVQVGGDLIRRCYRIRIDAQVARPWMRTGFTHPELAEYVKEQRGAVLGALLTLCRAWFTCGCPSPTTPTLGSFEVWSRTVGGILMVAGVDGFLSDQEAVYASSDAETPEWEAFLASWLSVFGSNWVTVAAIDEALRAQHGDRTLREALPANLVECVDKTGFRKRFGQALRKRLGMRYGDKNMFLQDGDDSHTKVKQWRVMVSD